MKVLKPMFGYESMAKQQPIEHSEFEAIEGGWKSLSKKIWEHSKII